MAEPLRSIIDPGWADALEPVAGRIAAMGDFLRAEVAAGRATPLLRSPEYAPDTHGPHGIGYATLPPPSRPRSERYAPEVIVEAARRRMEHIPLASDPRFESTYVEKMSFG